MVTDNPFNPSPVIPLQDLPPRQQPLRETASPSPILRSNSDGDLGQRALLAHIATSATNSPAERVTPPHEPAKTPRRVQWTADHVVNLAPLGDENVETQELDHTNIRDVNEALERFKRGRQTQHHSSISLSSMASSEASDHEHHHALHGSHRRHYPREHSNEQSEDDYDYRLDRGPYPDQGSEEDVSGNDLGRTEDQLLDRAATDHVAAYVPLGETDGLPSLPNDAKQSNEDEAANLVRSHTKRWGNLRQRVKRGSVRRAHLREQQDKERERRHWDETSRFNPSHEHHGNRQMNAPLNPPPGSDMPHIPGGSSVLGTLLALYNQQQLAGSTGTTPRSTAPPSREPSFDESIDERSHAPSQGSYSTSWSQKHLPWMRSRTMSDDFGPHKRNASMSSVADRTRSPRDTHGFLGSVTRAVDNFREDRPKAARSGAGVFGALIQNTGAVAAAAAPVSSTLMPSASKPGYHLNRYNLSRNHASPSASLPNSRRTSIYSTNENSPLNPEKEKDKQPSTDTLVGIHPARSKSSDNLLEMKTKKKRPVSLNLQKAEQFIRPFVSTPEREASGDSFFGKPMTEDERRRKVWEAEKRRRKKAKEARKKQEVFIIQHVANILARQHFILKLARALMAFGSPSHRLETQIQATARVLEINAQVVYFPGTMLVSFADDATHTSETKFLKQDTALDLGKLLAVHNVYWDVVHDKVSVDDANKELDQLMTSKPHYKWWQTILIGGLCSSFIVIPSFSGSFIDALMCAPLGMLLCGVQILAAKNDMFSNVFEITIATVISFLAAVLGSTPYFCYTALVSGGIVLILPGYIVLTGALEIASRNITAGAVRIAYSVMYSLFLGFGISIGAEIYVKISGSRVDNASDYQCRNTHREGSPWYMQTPSGYWYYLCVPGYSLALSLRNQQPLLRKELLVMVAIACAGWVTNHFAAHPKAFEGRSDIISALGSFCVGILGNLYGRFLSNGASFPVMVTGILFQLPSGLSQGGLFDFAADTGSGSSQQYSQGFGVAQQLVSVAIGLTVGLFVSAVVMYPLGGSRRRGSGIFSF